MQYTKAQNFILNCAIFWLELINQKTFEMKFFKRVYLTYLVIFHLKVIICQNVNLPHTTPICVQMHFVFH